MTAAPAKDGIKRVLYVIVRWVRLFVQENLGGHQNAIHAEPALRGLLLDKGSLQWMRIGRAAEPFQSRDSFALYGTRRCYAGADCRGAVLDRAGPVADVEDGLHDGYRRE